MENIEKIEIKKTGPKRTYDVPDCENRAYKVNVQYLNNRYKSDDNFKEYRKMKNAIYYQKRKEKLNK